MAFIPSGAKFTLSNGGSPSPSTDRGFDASPGDTITMQLEASPALDVRSCVYTIMLMTKSGPSLTLSSSGTASPPTASVTCVLPGGSAVYAFVIRCQTNGGESVKINGRDNFTANTSERIVVVRGASTHLRKFIVGETLEYDPVYGYTAGINEIVDAIEGQAQAQLPATVPLAGAPQSVATNTSATLALVPISPGLTIVRYVVKATINGEANELTTAAWRRIAYVQRAPSGAPAYLSEQGEGSLMAVQSPFVKQTAPYSTPIAGGVSDEIRVGGGGYIYAIVGSGLASPGVFVSGGTYALPASTAAQTLVINDGSRVYALLVGGVDSGSGGPTGTSSSITVGGLTWRYIGLTSAQTVYQIASLAVE